MDSVMTLLWWSAFLSGLSSGVGVCLLVVVIARQALKDSTHG